MSRQLLQIFVHPKSSHRYLELFCPLFKLPFSYPSHPLLLFPLLFCLLFKLPFSYPSHSLLLFSLLFCLFFKLPFSYLSHPLQVFPLLFCLFFILPFSYPFHPSQLFLLLLCLLFILSLTSPTQPSLLFPLLLCLLLPCPFFTFLSHFLIVAFPYYFSSTKAYFRQVLTLFFCSILSLLSITKPSIYVFICTYFHVII